MTSDILGRRKRFAHVCVRVRRVHLCASCASMCIRACTRPSCSPSARPPVPAPAGPLPARLRPHAFAAQPLGPALLPRVSPALGAAEGHQRRRSIRSGMASWPQGRQGSLTSGERGSLEPGTAVANVPSPGGPLAVLCSFERKGLWFNTGAARGGDSMRAYVEA